MAKSKITEKSRTEDYLHKYVWEVVKRQIRHAAANPNGATLDYLVAMTFESHALEGYANYLGERIAPDLWENERDQFRGTGLKGKLSALYQMCGLSPLEMGRRPGATVGRLTQLRDAIAHPRTVVHEASRKYAEDEEPFPFPPTYLSRTVSASLAVQGMEDVGKIVEELHAAAREKHPDKGLSAQAFGGIFSMTTYAPSIEGGIPSPG